MSGVDRLIVSDAIMKGKSSDEIMNALSPEGIANFDTDVEGWESQAAEKFETEKEHY